MSRLEALTVVVSEKGCCLSRQIDEQLARLAFCWLIRSTGLSNVPVCFVPSFLFVFVDFVLFSLLLMLMIGPLLQSWSRGLKTPVHQF